MISVEQACWGRILEWDAKEAILTSASQQSKSSQPYSMPPMAASTEMLAQEVVRAMDAAVTDLRAM